MLNYESILVFDFETTGLDPNLADIIEIAAIKYQKEEDSFIQVAELNALIDVGYEIPAKITEITNITSEMLAEEGEDFLLVLNQLLDLIDEKTLVVAYNISFDLQFLFAKIKQNGIDFNIDFDILDVMAIYKDHFTYPHRLESLVQKLEITHPNTHRAKDDVIATFLGLEKLSKIINVSSYINIIGYNPKYQYRKLDLPRVEYIAQVGGNKEIIKKIHPEDVSFS